MEINERTGWEMTKKQIIEMLKEEQKMEQLFAKIYEEQGKHEQAIAHSRSQLVLWSLLDRMGEIETPKMERRRK